MNEQKVQIPVTACPECGEEVMAPVGKPFKDDNDKLVEKVKCNKCGHEDTVDVKTEEQDGITVPEIKCPACGKGTVLPTGYGEWQGKQGFNMECDHCHHQMFYALNITPVDDDGNATIQYQIPACPKCGGKMETVGEPKQGEGNQATVDVKCEKCGYEAELEIEIEEN